MIIVWIISYDRDSLLKYVYVLLKLLMLFPLQIFIILNSKILSYFCRSTPVPRKTASRIRITIVLRFNYTKIQFDERWRQRPVTYDWDSNWYYKPTTAIQDLLYTKIMSVLATLMTPALCHYNFNNKFQMSRNSWNTEIYMSVQYTANKLAKNTQNNFSRVRCKQWFTG